MKTRPIKVPLAGMKVVKGGVETRISKVIDAVSFEIEISPERIFGIGEFQEMAEETVVEGRPVYYFDSDMMNGERAPIYKNPLYNHWEPKENRDAEVLEDKVTGKKYWSPYGEMVLFTKTDLIRYANEMSRDIQVKIMQWHAEHKDEEFAKHMGITAVRKGVDLNKNK